jgi:hypothetical protein
MFESYISRLRFAQRSHPAANARNALDVLFGIYPSLSFKRALTDVYVLRDSIFHNHLWEIEFSWTGSPSTTFHGAVLDPAYGDAKHRGRVNTKTRRTKALGLNIVPTRVDRRDALKVFKTVWKALLFLESKDRWQCYVSDQHIRYQREALLFGDLQDKLASAL